MFEPGDVISYLDMCRAEDVNLQRGMNFRLRGRDSVLLMSIRAGAPYADRVEGNGRVLVYEGHDVPRTSDGPDPKTVDQSLLHPSGRPTQNGMFFLAAKAHKEEKQPPERVKVYEKIRPGIWVFNGTFSLVDAWTEASGNRRVFRFRLQLAEDVERPGYREPVALEQSRLIPSAVKLAVWKRDKGRCVRCGSSENLHFDHVIPYSKGGSSLVAENIQLLCAKHNLLKRDRIE